MSAYIGGKQKIDEFQNNDKNVEVKEVLTNLFQRGFVNSGDGNENDTDAGNSSNNGNESDSESDDEQEQEPSQQDEKAADHLSLTSSLTHEHFEVKTGQISLESGSIVEEQADNISWRHEGDEDVGIAARKKQNVSTAIATNQQQASLYDDVDENEQRTLMAPKVAERQQNAADHEDVKSASDNDDQSQDSWDYATNYAQAIVPFNSLVCVPENLARSQVSTSSSMRVEDGL